MEKDKNQNSGEKSPRSSRETFQNYGRRALELTASDRLHQNPEVSEAFGPEFPLDAFLEIHPAAEIISDARYANKRHAEYGEERHRAKVLEEVVGQGIAKNNWLGEGFAEAKVFQTYAYDDYFNRNDLVVSAGELSFAIDVTYNSTKLSDKLTRPTNDTVLARTLPRGFGRVKYFDDGEEVGDEILPRFVIGLDYFDDKSIAKQSPGSPANERIRFKILSELFAQAKQNYESLLKSDPDVERPETATLEELYYTFDDALRNSVSDLALSKHSSFQTLHPALDHAKKFADQVHVVQSAFSAGDGVYKDTLRVIASRASDDVL